MSQHPDPMLGLPEAPHEEHAGNHERWVVSYADFITLLFATFVALYAISQVDKAKAETFEQSIREAMERSFSEKVTFTPKRPPRPPGPPKLNPAPSGSLVVAEERCIGGPAAGRAADPEAERMADALMKLADDPRLKGRVEVHRQADGEVLLRLAEAGIFGSGAAELQGDALPVLEAVAARLVEWPEASIRVEGHTDDVPVQGGLYGSNWALSAARATTVVTAFQERFGVAPGRLAIAGYGEHRPLAGNDSADGRARNLRIDLIVRRDPKEPSR